MKKIVLLILLLAVIPAQARFGDEFDYSEYYTPDEVDALLDLINYAFVTGNDVLTDILATELETLSDGSDAQSLHIHDSAYYTETESDTLFLKLDASNDPMQGNLDMGFFDIENPDNIDGSVDPAAISRPGISGTADTNTVNKLIDSTATFVTDGVAVDDWVRNVTDSTWEQVASIDSETELTLDSDAFPDGNEEYYITTLKVDAHWSFQDADNNTTLAAAEGGATFSLTAGTTNFCNRGVKKGIEYDGSTYHEATGYKGITGTGDWSLSFMIKPELDEEFNSFLYWGTSASTGRNVQTQVNNDNRIRMFFGNGFINGATPLVPNEWSHVLFVHPSGANYTQMVIYLNGVEDTGTNSGTNSVDILSGNDFRLGQVPAGGVMFTGCLDEVALFDSELTSANARNIFDRQQDREIRGTSNSQIDWTKADSNFSTTGTLDIGGDGVIDGALGVGLDLSVGTSLLVVTFAQIGTGLDVGGEFDGINVNPTSGLLTARDGLDVIGVTQLGDGGATNYTQFAADGELTLVGTARVFRSVDFEPEAVKQGGVGPGTSTEDGFPIHDFQATNDESVFMHWEVPHDYASGQEIHLHAEYFVDTAPVGAANVTWGVEYKKQSIGDNFDFGAGTTTVIVNDALTTGTPANDKQIHSSPEIQLITTGFEPMDVILMRFFRDADASEDGATDNFGSDARLFNYHLMFLSDKIGQAS